MIGTLLGGIGLFLLGMILMTDGLKAAAGDALRQGLERLTGGAGRAVLSGIGVTALVQSSTVTVLTTIGFVSAGLLTFTQAVGVIFGANLGTTSTGWIVSLLGLKVNTSAIALPLVGIGALARFVLRGRASSLGLALAGFGLLFVGIDLLQESMSTLAMRMDPGRFPGASVGGRALLVLVGIVMTVVLQSSSVAIATTLTAVHSGTIGLDQAMMLVIGQNIGTTVTAVVATIGASVPAKRTGLVHVLFNVVAAVAAFALAPLFLHVVQGTRFFPGVGDPAVALAAFHTGFKLLGVMILLPIAPRFGALVMRMIPERGSALTQNLDPSVAEVPAVAIEVARRTVLAIAAAEIRVATAVLRRMDGGPAPSSLKPVTQALGEVRVFLRHVRTSPTDAEEHERHLAVLHALDHLDRMAEALAEPPANTRLGHDGTATLRRDVVQVLVQVEHWLHEGGASPAPVLEAHSRYAAEHRRERRLRVLERAASGEFSPDEALERLEGLRWLDRLVYHVWRAVHHLAAPGEERVDDQIEVPPEADGVADALSPVGPQT